MTILALVLPPIRNFLDEELAGNPIRAWLWALAAFVAAFVVLSIAKRVLAARLAKLAERTSTDIDDLLLDLVRRTSKFFLVALAVFFAHHWLVFSSTYEDYLHRAIQVLLWIQAGLWGLGLVHFGIQRMVRGSAPDDPSRTMGASILGFIARVSVWSLVVLLCLQANGVPIGPLLASLGVGGIAVALALQNILGDLFASITILLDKPFVVGDFVVLGEFVGRVERIGIKSTRLRSITGEEIAIGNNDLVSSRLRNFKNLLDGRQQFTLGVTYQTSSAQLDRIPSIVKEIIEATPGTRFGRAHLTKFGDFALLYEVVYFVISGLKEEAMDAQNRINVEIHRRFEAEKIEFAYPTQTLYHVTPSGSVGTIQKELSRG
jgi:small-conductance mechanosensitive channel